MGRVDTTGIDGDCTESEGETVETGPESTADSFLAYQRMTFVNTARLPMDTSEIFHHNPFGNLAGCESG